MIDWEHKGQMMLSDLKIFLGSICDGWKLGVLSGFMYSKFSLSLYYLLCKIKNISIFYFLLLREYQNYEVFDIL